MYGDTATLIRENVDPAAAAQAPTGLALLKVVSVTHYTDGLFAFTTERPTSLRFRTGEFVMIGLMVEGKPLLRAYSIASPNWDDHLEFYSIKVPGGALTSRLQRIKPGDHVLIRPKPVGTLVIDALLPGRRLILLSTGTGIAPFASVIRDPETYEKFERVCLIQTAKFADELTYGKELLHAVSTHEYLGEISRGKLDCLFATTREASPEMGRIGNIIDDGRFAARFEGGIDPNNDRIMICGSLGVLNSLKAFCETQGFIQGSNAAPGQFVIEKAFIE